MLCFFAASPHAEQFSTEPVLCQENFEKRLTQAKRLSMISKVNSDGK